jgi:hypothetical protein
MTPPPKASRATPFQTRRQHAAAVDLPPELDRERLLDPTQSGGLLNIASITLAQWRAMGHGPPFVRVGRSIRYRLGDLLDWRDANTVGKRVVR